MLTQRAVQRFGYGIILVMALFVVLVWLRLVPESWYWTLVLIAALLFMVRLTLKLVLERQHRLGEAARRKVAETRNGE